MALFGPSDKDLKQDARKEYDKAVGSERRYPQRARVSDANRTAGSFTHG